MTRRASLATLLAVVASGCGMCGRPAPQASPDVLAVMRPSVPTDPDDPVWAGVPVHTAPLLLQDLVEPRLMTPSTAAVRVQAITNGTNVAFRLSWDDSVSNDLPKAGEFGVRARALAVRVVRSVGLPAAGIAVFLAGWSLLAAKIETSIGRLPGPLAVVAATRELAAEHQRERDKANEFYLRQDERRAAFAKDNPGEVFVERKYAGKPTYLDQIATSLMTVFTGFVLAALIAVREKALRDWRWRRIGIAVTAIGAAYTLFSEWMNVTLLGSWAYAESMPVLGLGAFEIGLSPLAQWLVIPPVALALARRTTWGRPGG